MLEVVLFFVIFLLAIILLVFYRKSSKLESELQDLQFRKSSQSVRYGKITEQFAPFIDKIPFEANNFRFIGSPIDGIAFESDSIIFCEFKSADSKLNENQKRIKELVKAGKIEWLEFRMR